ALEAARAVAHLGDAVLVARFAALKPVLPVRLDEEEPPARFERLVRGSEDEVGAAAVVERVVEERGVEAAVEVEALHVGDLEMRVDVCPFGKLACGRDHLGRDVVAVRVEPVSRCEAGHPAGAAAELNQAHARVQVEDLEYVAEVDQQPGRHPRFVPERLVAEPGAAFLADRDRVIDLGLLGVRLADRIWFAHGDRSCLSHACSGQRRVPTAPTFQTASNRLLRGYFDSDTLRSRAKVTARLGGVLVIVWPSRMLTTAAPRIDARLAAALVR